jgi:hypothetical protein
MYLVLTKEKPDKWMEILIRKNLKADSPKNSYDGEATNTIQKKLLEENIDCAIVTADSRFLRFANKVFLMNDIYIFNDGQLEKLTKTTNRKLRSGHNLVNLYEAGEFILKP